MTMKRVDILLLCAGRVPYRGRIRSECIENLIESYLLFFCQAFVHPCQ